MSAPCVLSVSFSGAHRFSKPRALQIRLIAGLGVEGDAHAGATIKHRSRVERDSTQPNLRQVHLIHAELFDELAAKGFQVASGDMGENITTRDLDLLSLPRGALLRIGEEAVVEVTGLRTPCAQLDRFSPGLMQATLERAPDGSLIRKAGVMGVVLASAFVHPGDAIRVQLPRGPRLPLLPV